MGHAYLLYTPQPLKVGMLDNIVKKRIGDGNESINGIVENFSFSGIRMTIFVAHGIICFCTLKAVRFMFNTPNVKQIG
jgi:hypothetical protein